MIVHISPCSGISRIFLFCKVIGSDKHEAFYYETQDGECVALFYNLGEKGFIQANFSSKLKDKKQNETSNL